MFDTPFDNRDDRDRRNLEAEPLGEGRFDSDPPLEAETAPPRRRKGWIALIVLAVIACLAWYLFGRDVAPAAAPPPPAVIVDNPLQMQITEWDEFIGRFEASKSVEVRPRVSGQITAIHFTDGQYVNAGALLFTIDPRPYRASLAEAQARVASANAALQAGRCCRSIFENLRFFNSINENASVVLTVRKSARETSPGFRNRMELFP